MKKSFFGDYILYKLRGIRGIAIASAVMNLLSTTLMGAVLIYFVSVMNKISALENGDLRIMLTDRCVSVAMIVLIAACAAIIVLVIIISVTPANVFVFFGKRNLTDTLGGLPLTYRQRFWGDFLGGLGAHMISFIPCSLLGLIFAATANNGINAGTLEVFSHVGGEERFINAVILNGPVGTYMSYIFMLFVGYMGAYAVSCLVTVCCGRTGSASVYSLICQILPAGLVVIYCYCAFMDTVGISAGMEAEKALAVIPPLGTWISAFIRFNLNIFSDESECLKQFFLLNGNPVCLIIAFILAALVIGAYYLGKLRKPERTGRDFVFGGVYHVLSAATIMVIIGMIQMIQTETLLPDISDDMFFPMIVAFVIYIVIDLSHMRSFKKLWLTALKYIAICLVFEGSALLTSHTGGFGAEKYIPPQEFVSEVRVRGENFFNTLYFDVGKGYVYRSDEAVSTILSEHKKIVDDIENAVSGDKLAITYVLKDGSNVTRFYSAADELPGNVVNNACDTIRKLTPTDSSILGFIDDPQYDSIEILYMPYTFGGSFGIVSHPAVFVKTGMEEEFMELLKHDIINNLSDIGHIVGEIRIDHSLNGTGDWEQYFMNSDFTNAIAFLSDPANITEKAAEEKSPTYTFILSWDYWISDFGARKVLDGDGKTISEMVVSIQPSDESAAAKELIGYIRNVIDLPDDEVSKHLQVHSTDLTGGAICVAKKDEQAVIRTMLKYIREKTE